MWFEIVSRTGSRSEIVYEALPTDDPQIRQPDISLARELLGWQPEVDLREGLRRTIEWTRDNLGLIEACIEKHREHMTQLVAAPALPGQPQSHSA